jgi:small subunit ribosomal protein S3Ae
MGKNSAVGKNKRLTKGKKGGKRKPVDPFLKKEWYKLQAPSMFSNKDFGKTIITKTAGQKIASDGLKGRIVEVSLADLQKNEDFAYRKIKLCIEDVQGFNCLTNFHGMDMTRDKICSLIQKRQTIIEANVDVKTSDGYIVRMFCIAFTKKDKDQIKETCYAKSAQVRGIREKMVSYMAELGNKGDLKTLVHTLVTADCGKDIEKNAATIFPIKECYIRKVKVLKKPKFDVTALMEWHDGSAADAAPADTGTPVATEEAVAGSGGRY